MRIRYEVRIFRFKGIDIPTIYHRENFKQVLCLLAEFTDNEFVKIEIVNIINNF